MAITSTAELGELIRTRRTYWGSDSRTLPLAANVGPEAAPAASMCSIEYIRY
ncbi:hypothetical protein [Bradyrhizobium manausense]|uniref:hypothetical protein n=1 Tax=Bradyrhizobium manausense TaxID=989370 RepID=UPI000A3F36F8|nr:hypothetical protein [Bradyrhizobium manausense]